MRNQANRSVTVHSLLKAHRDEILRIASEHGACNVRIFGSMARDEADDQSDIDFLIQVGPKTSPWFPAGLILDLEQLLGKKVDVVTEDSVYWLLHQRIVREAVPL